MRPVQTRNHFLSGASLPNLLRVIWQNRSEIRPDSIPPLLLILFTPLMLCPLYLVEKLLFSRRINQTRIPRDPVFIIGHFRSGTTYLHNLLCCDPQFGFPTTYQCFVPGTFMTGGKLIKAIHKTTLPEKRPMDDVKLDQDFPQEEEFALQALTPWSYYQCYVFPHKIREYFTRFSLLGNGIAGKWERSYLFIVRKMTLVAGGRQLVLKNPVNTTRIERLQQLFPDAKFIYLHRDPAEVLRSTLKLFTRFLDWYSFRQISEEELIRNISWVYAQTIAQYEKQKQSIREGHLVEISYHDLIRQPLDRVREIYKELDLPGFDQAEEKFRGYIASQSTFVRDQYPGSAVTSQNEISNTKQFNPPNP